MNMIKKRSFQIARLGIILGLAGWSHSPFALGSERQVPQMTLQVPRVNNVNAETWCRSAGARGTGRPLGFNKVGFYPVPVEIKHNEYLIGCITNNSGKTIEFLQVVYQFQYPSNTFPPSGGVTTLLGGQPLQPRQTVFFGIWRIAGIDPKATGAIIDIYTANEPLQRLIVRRR